MLASAPGEDLTFVLEQMSDAFFLLDSSWTVVACNAEHERLSKLSRSAQIGKDFRQLFLSDAGADGARFYAHYLRAMLSRRPTSFTEHYPPLGLWVECRVFPTDRGGLAVFCRDVTEVQNSYLARAEDKHRFASMFSTAPAGMALLRGENLVFEHVNEKYTALIGGRQTVGRKFVEVLHELKGQPFEQLLRDVLRSGEPYVEIEREISYIRRAGEGPEKRFVNFAYHQICDLDARPDGVFIFVDDVTDQVHARQQLLDGVRSRDDFMSFCSHELRTPLTALKLAAQSTVRKLQRGTDELVPRSRVSDVVAKFDRQFDRLQRLIDEMGDFSRLHRGNLKLQPEPCDLGKVLGDAIQRVAPELQQHGVKICLHQGGELDGAWDPLRLEQVCINLLTNAAKYGCGRPVDVILQGDKDGVALEVRDHGAGIEEADRERIFLAYERASASHRGGSLGVGLYISRCIVEAHGGSIRVESVVGEGSSFRVRLPRAPPVQSAHS